MACLSEEVLRRIRKVLPDSRTMYALHEPAFVGNELEYVTECIQTGWVSSVGKFVDRIEAQLAGYVGTKRAVAVVNGTAALQMSLVASGLQTGDEVLVPTLTFVATANAVVHAGGIPHFIDTGEKSLNIDPLSVEKYLDEIAMVSEGVCRNRKSGRRIFAIIPVHVLGHACQVDQFALLAEKYCLVMIEDIAEGLGTLFKGQHVGKFGKLAALSFNGNKIITTGGGGAVLTDDNELADKIKHLTTTAKLPHRWEYVHDCVGYNFRMPNLNAALGCAQLERMGVLVTKKRMLAERYAEVFDGLSEIRFMREPVECKSNYWLNAISLTDPNSSVRDEILRVLNDQKIQSRPMWRLMHTLPMYVDCPHADMTCAVRHEAAVINIPSSPFLADT